MFHFHASGKVVNMVRPWTAFWRALTKFEAGKIVPEIAVRNTIGFIAADVLATVFGSPSAGVLAGIGALNVSYSDSRDPYISRLRRMLLSSAVCAVAVTLGALSGYSNVTAVTVAALWAFAAGMLVALGTAAGDLGVITLVTLVVFAARPLSPVQAVESGLLAFGGGLLQTLLAIALWPIRPYEPERRIVASLYQGLATIARSAWSASSAPPISNQISDAQEALTSLSRDHSAEAERLVYLLNQAERIRLSILNLGRLRRRLARDERGQAAADALSALLEATALALAGKPGEHVDEFHAAARSFQKRDWGAYSSFFTALIRDASQEVDALAGQLRSVTRVTSLPLVPRDAREPWRRRFSSRLAKIEANLSFGSTVFRHAVRLAVCLAAGDALGRAVSLQRTYWIPMTIAIVLKPDFTATVSRGVLRIAGTFAGLILATVLFHFIHTGVETDIALMTIFVFLLRWIGPANYGIFVTALSSMIVLLIATTGVSPFEVIHARAVNTAAGGALALIAYAVWPTWERTQVGTALAELIEEYRKYFSRVMTAYTSGSTEEIDKDRMRARRARSNAEASVDRMSGEPGISVERLNNLNAILVNSHMFVNAVMALESGLHHTGTAPPRPPTLAFATRVDETLSELTGALREGRPVRADMPNLREAHNRIMESHELVNERYSLVNIETDRITTSVNTLCEQVAVWEANTNR